MLILLDPELLAPSALSRLLDFLRHPYAETSCQWVDEALPALAPVYRTLARSVGGWAAASNPALARQALDIFRPVTEVEGRQLTLMPEYLGAAQVILLQENVRDYAELSKNHAAKPPASAVSAMHGAALHEAAFFTLAGLFSMTRHADLIEFSLTATGKTCMRNRTLSVVLDALSVESLRQHMLTMASPLDPVQVDLLVARLLDSQFSIGADAQLDTRVKPLIGRAAQLCRWGAVLELARLAGHDAIRLEALELARLRLDSDLLEQVLASQSSALTSDRGIHRLPSGGLSLSGTSLQHAITSCKAAVLSDKECQLLGCLFEQFVRRHIEQTGLSQHFLVRPGFKSEGKDKGKSYDCDLLLYQVRRKRLFFVQAKWKRAARTANLEDDIKSLRAGNSPVTHGVDQLRALRERLGERGVMNQVLSALGDVRLSAEHILANAHFIVLHTQPFFSAYAREGVAIYEWNLFRNLMAHEDASLPLEDPASALMFYCDVMGVSMDACEQQAMERDHARYGFDVAPKSCWRRLTGKGGVRVLRPYT